MEPSTQERSGANRETVVDAGVLPDPGAWRRPSPAELQIQLDQAAAVLESALVRQDLTEFYAYFRSTDLPYVALLHAGDPRAAAHTCCKILHRLGGISPAVGLSIQNHLFVTGAIVTFPHQDDRFEARRESLLRLLREQRLLVANTNSHVHADKLETFGVIARREGDRFRIRGSAAFMSLATQGDLIVFLSLLEGEGPALFTTSLRDNPGIEIGPFLFPRFMQDSDTRRVTFRDLLLPEEAMLLSGRTEQLSRLNLFEMVWGQLLLPAVYLGAAARALDEVRLFLRSVRGHDDRPLSELDGMVIDIGRLVIRYRTAWALVLQTADRLGEVARSPLEPASLSDLFDLSSVAKHAGTVCAEELVIAARRLIGARSFTGDAPRPIERFSQETPFGPLGPEVNALIERRLGRRALGETPILTERL